MRKRLTNNWGLKLIAVIAAVMIWLLIMNTSDPVTTFTISGIPIEFLNEQSAITDNEMIYEVIGKKTATVEVTTRTRDRDKIKAGDFKATVNLNEIYGVTGNVGINVQLVNNASLVRSWRQTNFFVEIKTEKIINKTFEVEAVQEGQIEDGYVYRQCTLSQNTVTLRGPESQIAKVASVKAIVDVSQSLDDEQISVKLRYFNANGTELNIRNLDIGTNHETVDAHIVVQKTSPVSIDVVVKNKDNVAEGYRYITYRISNQSISVIGSKQSVAGLDKIQIEMDAFGAEGDIVKEIDLTSYLPENVSVAGGNTKVTVTLVVEAEGTLELEVPVKNIEIIGRDEEKNYLIAQKMIKVSIFGLMSDWENITNEDVKLSVDVSELDEGEYSLVLEVEEIDGLQIDVLDKLEITVERVEEETTEPEETTGEDITDDETTDSETDESEDATEVGATEAPSEEGSEEETEEESIEETTAGAVE